MDLLRLITAGSVDDGSQVIGLDGFAEGMYPLEVFIIQKILPIRSSTLPVKADDFLQASRLSCQAELKRRR